MRVIAATLFLCLLAALPVKAQQPTADCGPTTQNYLPELPAPGSPYVSVATDLRGAAPVKPAIVVNLVLPGGAKPFMPSGEYAIRIGSGSVMPLTVARAEAQLVAAGPRAPVVLAEATLLAPLHQAFQTQYRFYLRVPEEAGEQFIVAFPQFVSRDRVLSIPPLRLRRIASDPGVEICSALPGRGG